MEDWVVAEWERRNEGKKEIEMRGLDGFRIDLGR